MCHGPPISVDSRPARPLAPARLTFRCCFRAGWTGSGMYWKYFRTTVLLNGTATLRLRGTGTEQDMSSCIPSEPQSAAVRLVLCKEGKGERTRGDLRASPSASTTAATFQPVSIPARGPDVHGARVSECQKCKLPALQGPSGSASLHPWRCINAAFCWYCNVLYMLRV